MTHRHSPALRDALGLPASSTPTETIADGETMSQPEARLGRAIQQACKARGAFAFKVHGGPTMMVGLPDQIMCYRGQFVAMEVKMPTGSLSKIQERRLHEIRSAGGHAFVVRSVEDAMDALDDVDRALDTQEPADAASA